MITGLAHACYFVPNLERTLAFYRDGLGLPVAFEFRGDDGSVYGAYVKLGRRTFLEFFASDKQSPAPDKSGWHHISLEVDDLQKTVAEMRSRGIEVSEPSFGKDNSWQAWTADPDGNRIELHHYSDASLQTPHC